MDDSDDDEDRVASLFNKARQAGAVQGTSADMEKPGGAFKGRGRTLAAGDGGADAKQVMLVLGYGGCRLVVSPGRWQSVLTRARSVLCVL